MWAASTKTIQRARHSVQRCRLLHNRQGEEMSVIPAGDFALQTIQQEISAMIREGMTVQRLKIIQTQAQNLHYELKVARTAIQQVRELHESDNAEAYLSEYKEGNARCKECLERYPCTTIQALNSVPRTLTDEETANLVEKLRG